VGKVEETSGVIDNGLGIVDWIRDTQRPVPQGVDGNRPAISSEEFGFRIGKDRFHPVFVRKNNDLAITFNPDSANPERPANRGKEAEADRHLAGSLRNPTARRTCRARQRVKSGCQGASGK